MEAPLPVQEDPEKQEFLKRPEEPHEDDLPPASYWNLLCTHRQYRLFLTSAIVTDCGEWLNYVASMAVLEKEHDATSSPNRHLLISLLIVVRLLPNVFISPFGGVLADTRDLRHSMMVLDVTSAGVALLFWVAYILDSSLLIYVATFLQQCLAGLYEPCKNAIVPQMVKDANYLQKATTLSGLAWSTMAAVGSSVGGFLAASLGIPMCFVLDSVSYVLSALLLWQIGGEWNVAGLENAEPTKPWWSRLVGMSWDGIQYMKSSQHGAIVLIKGSGALMYGASDVMNAAFAEVNNEMHSERLGMLFASVGVGALLGPMVTDKCVDMERLMTVQRLCVAAFGVISIGYVGIGASRTFASTCLWTVVRASGMSVSWIDSSLLIQTIMPPAMLGRIFAADTALATLGECVSAVCAGFLLDNLHLSANELAFVQALVALVLFLLWVIYHSQVEGIECEKKSSVELTENEKK